MNFLFNILFCFLDTTPPPPPILPPPPPELDLEMDGNILVSRNARNFLLHLLTSQKHLHWFVVKITEKSLMVYN